jgi:membrane-associated phospholipid phosphatase
VIINLAMMASTPVGGSHYFVDVFAGIALAFFAIATARLADRRLAERVGASSQTMVPIPSPRRIRDIVAG